MEDYRALKPVTVATQKPGIMLDRPQLLQGAQVIPQPLRLDGSGPSWLSRNAAERFSPFSSLH